ncbi:hypothetical protein [Halosimplex halophilum]|uniref:hypothetical protein n=1 Tax=Halosimplex halophilum TaxID=2559572 RepID=UPI00107F3BC5|nr:hypothetical protein [Halosimplex halophilum]
MDEATSADGDRVPVEWRRVSLDGAPSPVVRRVPYLELKLEHPDLEPTGRGDRFFPDAVPYELDGRPRVFYWRPALDASTCPDGWVAACATTHGLAGFGSLPTAPPPLVSGHGEATVVVVDGAVGGDATTARVRSYDPPAVRVDAVTESAVELTVAGAVREVPVGERRRFELAEQRVEPADVDGETAVAPELVVRYPGRRELHHPVPGTDSRVFPSFGLDLDDLSNPLPVPTAAGELDDAALATAVGVDLSERPYPERALWQAFAYTAFDPHADAAPTLGQLPDGRIVLRDGALDEK